jgi:hypothetical protein
MKNLQKTFNKNTIQQIILVILGIKCTDEDLFEYFKMSTEGVNLILQK